MESGTETSTVVNTGIATKERIAEMLHKEVLPGRHLQTPLCMTHYKQLYRLSHTEDHMQTEKSALHVMHIYAVCQGTAQTLKLSDSISGDIDIPLTEKN